MIGKIYQSPKINQSAPTNRASRWDEVSGVAEPFTGPKTNEFGFWFNYFWAEVRVNSHLTPVQRTKAADTFLEVFSVAQGVATIRTDFAGRSDSFKENVLRQLLLLGFRRVSLKATPLTARRVNGRMPAPPPLQAVDAAALNLDYTIQATADSEEGAASLPIAFRCDGRPYEVLVRSDGMKPRARSIGEKVFSDYAMDQPWHPFNNEVYSNSLWLRLGEKNKDNCLQTVISVGPTFAEIAHFPILNDYVLVFQAKSADGRFLALKPADEWTDQDMAAAAGHWLKVRAVRDPAGGVNRIEKDNQLYVFHLRGLKGVNTSAQFTGHDKFPERGMEAVPLSHFLAEVQFVQRWWFNPEERQFMLYELAFSPIRWLPSEEAVDLKIGRNARMQLDAVISGEVQRARRRKQFLDEENLYRQYQQVKATLLTAGERKQIVDALKAYWQTALSKDKVPSKERNAVKVSLPNLAGKIDGILPLDWKEVYQRRAKEA